MAANQEKVTTISIQVGDKIVRLSTEAEIRLDGSEIVIDAPARLKIETVKQN